jgi:hypothetical protein
MLVFTTHTRCGNATDTDSYRFLSAHITPLVTGDITMSKAPRASPSITLHRYCLESVGFMIADHKARKLALYRATF